MRTIKFRGKRVNGGEWVESMTISHSTIKRKAYEVFFEISPNKWVGVIPETVGQFTGLLDKNGKEIYEGDIVSVDDFSSAYSSPYTGKVIMRGGQWCVEYYKEYRCCPPLFFDDFADRKTEVVGNIYDNPELLKGGEK